MANRLNKYKNKALDGVELRRRREEEGVQLRKSKREEQVSKRRNVDLSASFGNDVTFQISPTKDEQQIPRAVDPQLVSQLYSDDSNLQLEATQAFRKMLSKDPTPAIEAVILAGAIPRFVEFLQRIDDSMLQFEAAWVLTNIASGTSEQTQHVVQANAVPIFIQLLQSPHENVREQAIWALGNIAGDNTTCRDYLLQCNIVSPLLLCLNNSTSLAFIRNAVWCVSNLCRGKNPAPDFSKIVTFIPVLSQLLFQNDTDTLADACWAIAYLSDGPNEKVQAVIEAGVCRRLVELLIHPEPNVITAALRSVGNIVTGDDTQTQVILNCNVLPNLLHLLSNSKEGIRKEASWTISNITAGSKQQIQAVIDANIIPALVNVLRVAEFKTRKEAAWAITNASSGGSKKQINYLAGQGCIGPLCDLLTVMDTKIITVALNGLENILKAGQEVVKSGGSWNPYAMEVEECFGLDKIEMLQQHKSEEIYQKAYLIIDTYFPNNDDDDDEDKGIVPEAEMSGNGFQFNNNMTIPDQGFHL